MTAFSQIPKVDKLLAEPAFQLLQQTYPYPLLLKTLRDTLDTVRTDLRAGHFQQDSISSEFILAAVTAGLERATAPSLRRVINATGTIIHTNLGRSPLPAKIARHLADIASHYCNLELDTGSGERGDRHLHVEPLICELTGAEAALVVNNNAAALLLALTGLSRGKEVIVSRGELVEIGGSFRIPEIMEQSGARLREVGTTNRTHLKDYQQGVTAETALLLKVSCSNFAMVGFTAEVGVAELAKLGVATGLPLPLYAGGQVAGPSSPGSGGGGGEGITISVARENFPDTA
ncbi:MAG: L-seryl-tRNA(Sec) selenium transferase, partial [Geobacter sp.]|nr:L-seryl-tRNA(Sec) selenium transferase [Geobacter sp.]